jgi:prevent-host-death family protein
MIKVNIHEAKANLSKYMDAAERGERVVLCRRNEPIVELTPLKKMPRKRPIGLAKGMGLVPPEFFDPLPEDIQAYFEGKANDYDDPL